MRDVKILSDRMLHMKDSAEHSRCTCVNRPPRSADGQLHNNAPNRKCLRKKTTACVSLFDLFTVKRGTFPIVLRTTAIQHQLHIKLTPVLS